MNSPSDKIRELVEELRQDKIMFEGEANEFYTQSVDPHSRSLGEAYLKGSIDATEFVTRRPESLLGADKVSKARASLQIRIESEDFGIILKNS